MNKNAIVVYLQKNKPNHMVELSWLWKSWKLYNKGNWDLVVFTDPEQVDDVANTFADTKVYAKSQHQIAEIKDNEDLNNIAMFADSDFDEVFSNYDWILRTPHDTVLTKYFFEFEPWEDKIYVGPSTVFPNNDSDLTWNLMNRLKGINDMLKLNYNGITSTGHSILAKRDVVIAISKLQLSSAQILLRVGWKPEENGHKPGWHRDYVLDYAFQIAINHIVLQNQIVTGCLGSFTGNNKITSIDLTLSVGKDPNVKTFNKDLHHKGELPIMKYGRIPKTAGEYCLLIANEDLKYLRMCVEKEG